jgi:hypothetical protein
LHRDLVATAEQEAHAAPPAFIYRKPQNSPVVTPAPTR